MSPASPVGAPSLSQILGWDTAHLHQAATDWVNTAEHWEGSFTSAHRDTLSPGGTSWEVKRPKLPSNGPWPISYK